MQEFNSGKLVKQSVELISVDSSDISPFVKKVKIKAFHLGLNRNGSSINEEVGIQMGKSLLGAPIVGHYVKEQEDFGGHDSKLEENGREIAMKPLTVPYGFVDPCSELFFEEWEDTYANGLKEINKYLCCYGYVWLKQFNELKDLCTDGKGQSMELDTDTLSGHWETDEIKKRDFYVIDEAYISKLCILGDDVEACMATASITPTNFGKNEQFFSQLNSMKEELVRFQINKNTVEKENNLMQEKELKELQEQFELLSKQYDVLKQEYADCKTKCEKAEKENEDNKKKKEEEAAENAKKEECAKNALVEENQKLSEQVKEYEIVITELQEYKNEQENAKKDEMINSFSMLSEEDKADVIEHKAEYSLEDIESKLAVICYRKKLDLSGQKANENTDATPATSYNLAGDNKNLSGLAQALENHRKNK